jgi:hypothetical protein
MEEQTLTTYYHPHLQISQLLSQCHLQLIKAQAGYRFPAVGNLAKKCEQEDKSCGII